MNKQDDKVEFVWIFLVFKWLFQFFLKEYNNSYCCTWPVSYWSEICVADLNTAKIHSCVLLYFNHPTTSLRPSITLPWIYSQKAKVLKYDFLWEKILSTVFCFLIFLEYLKNGEQIKSKINYHNPVMQI